MTNTNANPGPEMHPENAASLRVFAGAGCGALLLGGGLAGLLSLLWAPLGYTSWFFIPLFLLVFLGCAIAGPPVSCPHCGKRVKVGYDTCHHCGRTTTSEGGVA